MESQRGGEEGRDTGDWLSWIKNACSVRPLPHSHVDE